MGQNYQEITIHHDTFWLLPERALYWPKHRLLAVADLHWGKVGTFQAAGIPIPQAVERSDLERLKNLTEQYPVKDIVILGDLVHHRDGLTQDLFFRISEWRSQIDAQIHLIRGNHDRWLTQLPMEWDMHVTEDELLIEGFAFTHFPASKPEYFVWAGHVHPSVHIASSNDSLKLPCFQIGKDMGIIPAFSEFTGGGMIDIQETDQVFAIAGLDIINMTRY